MWKGVDFFKKFLRVKNQAGIRLCLDKELWYKVEKMEFFPLSFSKCKKRPKMFRRFVSRLSWEVDWHMVEIPRGYCCGDEGKNFWKIFLKILVIFISKFPYEIRVFIRKFPYKFFFEKNDFFSVARFLGRYVKNGCRTPT